MILYPVKLWFIIKVIFPFLFPVFFLLKQSATFGLSSCVQSDIAQIYYYFLYFWIRVIKPPFEVCIVVSASTCCLKNITSAFTSVFLYWTRTLRSSTIFSQVLQWITKLLHRNLAFNQRFSYIKLCLNWIEVFAVGSGILR